MLEGDMAGEGGRPRIDAADAVGPLVIAARITRTPLGPLRVTASDSGLLSIEFPGARVAGSFERWLRERILRSPETAILTQALGELAEYFAGTRRAFAVPLEPAGTPFQCRVWQRVCGIPFGETAAYGALAADLGDLQSARAVGAAVAVNPLPIVIPCHRVVGAGGSLTGYRGGFRRKAWLLRHEGALLT
jgi:methylated-DNA-[protein]-cysteine S-methyltransferase